MKIIGSCSPNVLLVSQGAVQAGHVKVPPGYHPFDVEKEWGRLHIAILERERLLRTEFERYVGLNLNLIICSVAKANLPKKPQDIRTRNESSHTVLLCDHEDDSFPNAKVQFGNKIQLGWLCGMGS